MSSERDSAHVGLKIGRTLELARKERGLSLGEVEEETKIRTRYLRELERENFEVLPPVYVQGSLKTYANFLGLDGEAFARELRRRQPLEPDLEAPTQVEPPRGDYLDRYLISRGAVGVGDQEIAEDEENAAGAAPVPAGDNRRLYLVSGAFLALILVSVALVLTLAKGSQQEVSQVREPLVSHAPSQVSHASDEGSGPALQEDSGSASPRSDPPAGQQNEDARDDAAGQQAREPADATAVASAPPATGTATAGPAATPAPANDEPANDGPAPNSPRPAPAASETPAPSDQGVVEGPVAHDDGGPVKNFSITRDAPAGGTSSPGGSRTSGSCSRDGDGPKVLRDKEGFRACLSARVGGDG